MYTLRPAGLLSSRWVGTAVLGRTPVQAAAVLASIPGTAGEEKAAGKRMRFPVSRRYPAGLTGCVLLRSRILIFTPPPALAAPAAGDSCRGADLGQSNLAVRLI